MSKILVGHDSECFAVKKDGLMFPMIGNVGGTKEHPLLVPGGNLQEDNVSIEMAIDPTSDIDIFISRTKAVYEELSSRCSAVQCSVVIAPTVQFQRGVLDNFAPISKEQGCDPDYNIYTKKENNYPSVSETEYRHGSGHLHIDCPSAVEDPSILSSLIMLCDMLIKAPQWLLEGNVGRNQVQGALGNYRPKSYGVEYRSSSNIILTDDKILRHAFTSAQNASEQVTNGRVVSKAHGTMLQKAFRDEDKSLVKSLISAYDGAEI